MLKPLPPWGEMVEVEERERASIIFASIFIVVVNVGREGLGDGR